MARFLIDSTTLIDYSLGREPVTRLLTDGVLGTDEFGVCAVVLAEFFAGVTPDRRAYWEAALSPLTFWQADAPAGRRAGVLRYDAARRGRQLSTTDCLIAAVALQHGAAVVTDNLRDFGELGVDVVSFR